MQPPRHDVLIIGGGLSGLIHLRYAGLAGLDAVLVEKTPALGGLWRDLPAWQDIQICLADWTAGDLPLAGPRQPEVLANVCEWATRFGLRPRIRLSCPVERARHRDGVWEVDTPQGTLRATHLVCASGVHNQAHVPPIERRDAAVQEYHSSALRDPDRLAGRHVLVVGGGASAFDLLDLCVAHGAARISWVYRNVRWFTPTSRPKVVAGSFRPFAKMQASGLPVEKQNATIGADLEARYARFGLEAIRPEHPIDMRRHQLIPGRARMLEGFARLERHRGTVAKIEQREVVLDDGTRLAADLLLWATGYRTDLSYFENPAIAAVRGERELAARCGCIFRSLDEPNLYFTGIGLEGIGAPSMMFALGARTIMSHILGRARLDLEPVPHKLNHLDMIRHLAERDPASFEAEGGWQHYRELSLTLRDDEAFPLPPLAWGRGAAAPAA